MEKLAILQRMMDVYVKAIKKANEEYPLPSVTNPTKQDFQEAHSLARELRIENDLIDVAEKALRSNKLEEYQKTRRLREEVMRKVRNNKNLQGVEILPEEFDLLEIFTRATLNFILNFQKTFHTQDNESCADVGTLFT